MHDFGLINTTQCGRGGKSGGGGEKEGAEKAQAEVDVEGDASHT